MELETKFITLDNRESSFEKVTMHRTVVFYPYFRFKPAKISDAGGAGNGMDKAYRIALPIGDFGLQKLLELEKTFSSGRPEDYGFWTVRKNEGCFIGMGARNLQKILDKAEPAEACFVLLSGNDIILMAKTSRTCAGYENPNLEIYFSDADSGYGEKMKAIGEKLAGIGLRQADEELKADVVGFDYMRYTYYDDAKRPRAVQKSHSVSPASEPKAFLDNVHGCTWHTIVYNDNVINEGPHFVLLRNCGLSLGNILDDLSCWLVHRRGGFVMGKEFASNDFTQETTFIIREIDEYRIGDVVILNIECDTYTKNRDEGLENFLKNISEARFHRDQV